MKLTLVFKELLTFDPDDSWFAASNSTVQVPTLFFKYKAKKISKLPAYSYHKCVSRKPAHRKALLRCGRKGGLRVR